MILRLFCPRCAHEAVKEKNEKGLSSIVWDVQMPVSRVSDDGRYDITCAIGHISQVTLDNVKFELLFELGLNALMDGYPREAVSSFASALERFYEFYWHAAADSRAVPQEQTDAAWKVAAKQSERQLGMFVSAGLFLTKACPKLLNPNRETKLRNDVIHGGRIPSATEATLFGDEVMRLINESLTTLRGMTPDTLLSTYTRLSPAGKGRTAPVESARIHEETVSGVVNILTAVDVRHPAAAEGDPRRGGVEQQFKRIRQDREPHRLTMVDELPKQK